MNLLKVRSIELPTVQVRPAEVRPSWCAPERLAHSRWGSRRPPKCAPIRSARSIWVSRAASAVGNVVGRIAPLGLLGERDLKH